MWRRRKTRVHRIAIGDEVIVQGTQLIITQYTVTQSDGGHTGTIDCVSEELLKKHFIIDNRGG